jgi:predicted transcriptional regulator of viral defense system
MKKIDALYKVLLQMRVVSFSDIMHATQDTIGTNFSTQYTYNKYLTPLLKDKKLVRVKQGLYLVLDPLETPEKFSFDPLLLGSKIKERYYLGFHTALEFYGCAHSPFNTVYICIHKKDKFNQFLFHNRTFKPVYTNENKQGIEEQTYLAHIVKVSSRERTFLDCIDRVDYAGGWEECLKSLESMSGIQYHTLAELLNVFGHDVLFRKTGFILQMLRDVSLYYRSVDDRLLESLKKKVGSSPIYLEKGKSSLLNREWNLYVPKHFHDYVRGV